MPSYQPVPAERIETHIATLTQARAGDFLFLARREKSFLFTLPAVYTADSYENLTWTYGLSSPHVPVVALFLRIFKVMETHPIGSVTLLDYPATARDVEVFAPLPTLQKERHIQLITKRCTKQTSYCSLVELMQFLKTGR